MIDWYMLLAPLVVLPIILLFAFVGCGEAAPSEDPDSDLFGKSIKRPVHLHWSIPKKTPDLTGIKCTFEFHIIGDPSSTHPEDERAFNWAPDPNVEVGKLDDEFRTDEDDGPIACTCTVTLVVKNQPEQQLPPFTTPFTSEPEICFELNYVEWPPPSAEYNWGLFNLAGQGCKTF